MILEFLFNSQVWLGIRNKYFAFKLYHTVNSKQRKKSLLNAIQIIFNKCLSKRIIIISSCYFKSSLKRSSALLISSDSLLLSSSMLFNLLSLPWDFFILGHHLNDEYFIATWKHIRLTKPSNNKRVNEAVEYIAICPNNLLIAKVILTWRDNIDRQLMSI